MENDALIILSRLQFAITALYHFIFVPLTLGLSVIIAIMETVYVMTGRLIWRDMVKFWGILFGINFAMGVATGITMEFQFGTNWAYYSHYVGDIFGIPLAIEGMMAFFLEATFVGVFFFGWNRISPVMHCISTWILALGTNLSAFWILVANGWMQHPVGSYFNYDTMRMELSSFFDILFNPVAQAKFVHTVSAGYVVGSMFVLSLSCYYLLRGRCKDFAKRSIVVASAFGLASALSVVVLGDESGYLEGEVQKVKLASIEAMWETEKPPASFTLFGFPDMETKTTKYKIEIPYVLGLIATRSLDTPVMGLKDLVEKHKDNIAQGIRAYNALTILKTDKTNASARAEFEEYGKNLGYGLLLKHFVDDPNNATPEIIEQAAWYTIPHHIWLIFWSFRVMVACGFYFILLFALMFWNASKRNFDKKWLLKLGMLSLPLPWVAAEAGWVVAEYGRQPWVIEGFLPTSFATSDLSTSQVAITLAGFILLYSSLLVVELYLMRKYIRKGPEHALASLAGPNEITDKPFVQTIKNNEE